MKPTFYGIGTSRGEKPASEFAIAACGKTSTGR